MFSVMSLFDKVNPIIRLSIKLFMALFNLNEGYNSFGV